MNRDSIEEWKKGGIRYAKLKRVVPELLSPDAVRVFFVAVRGRRMSLLNPFSPVQREYVVALTERRVVVLRLKRPGVFRASVAGKAYEASVDEADAGWRDGALVLGGVEYRPIHFHEDDAEELAGLLGV